MATTANKIEKALSILNHHDWYWMMCDSNSAYGWLSETFGLQTMSMFIQRATKRLLRQRRQS